MYVSRVLLLYVIEGELVNNNPHLPLPGLGNTIPASMNLIFFVPDQYGSTPYMRAVPPLLGHVDARRR